MAHLLVARVKTTQRQWAGPSTTQPSGGKRGGSFSFLQALEPWRATAPAPTEAPLLHVPVGVPFPRPCCLQNGVHTPHPGLWGPPTPPPELRSPVFPGPCALAVLLSGVCQTFLPTSNITSSKLIIKICPKSEHSPHFHCHDPGPTPGRLSPDLLN